LGVDAWQGPLTHGTATKGALTNDTAVHRPVGVHA